MSKEVEDVKVESRRKLHKRQEKHIRLPKGTEMECLSNDITPSQQQAKEKHSLHQVGSFPCYRAHFQKVHSYYSESVCETNLESLVIDSLEISP